MFTTWGRFVFRHRWGVLVFAMTALPAILSLLGARVNRLALRRTA